MRSRRNQNRNDLPEINLVPMMDVLMTVLTFFIIVSMTFNAQQLNGINVPKTQGKGADTEQADERKTMVVGLAPQGKIRMGDRELTPTELGDRMGTFLRQTPEGQVLLKADRGLNYKEVATLLKTMRDVGGDRVSLSITAAKEE